MVRPPADRALALARRAEIALDLSETRDTAWLALAALDLDPACGLAWALASRIVLEVSHDPLGTLAMRYALDLGVVEPERAQVERYHRIDLWARGLLAHGHPEDAILKVGAFEDGQAFRVTARSSGWFEEQGPAREGLLGAAEAVRRMVAAFSDAWIVPEGDDNPLWRAEPWETAPGFTEWRQSLEDIAVPVEEVRARRAQASARERELTVLSDYWIEQEILRFGVAGALDLARERAELWARLRPRGLRPRAALTRVLHVAGWIDARDRVVGEMIGLESEDLNELEEARVVLGELALWQAQLEILNRMDDLHPDNGVILANRGVALLQIGETSRGERDLEAAIEADPDNGPALANLGLQRMKADEYVAARTLLERAVRVAPHEPQVRVYLAACKNNQDDRRGAIAELEEALRLDPDHAQAQQLLDELRARGPV